MIMYDFNYGKIQIPQNHLNAVNKCWFFFEPEPRWVFLEHKYITTCSAKYYAPFYAMTYDFSLLTDCELSDRIIRSLMIAGPNKKFTAEELFSIVRLISFKPLFKYDVMREMWKLVGEGRIVIESGLISLKE
jgi:hypothetical protein